MCTDKKTLRGRYLAERASLSAEEKQAIDRGIAQNILQSEFYQQADCIFCYVSTAEEIDTRTALENALASGRTVCVPLCGKGGSVLRRTVSEYLLAFYARKENRGLDIFADCNALQ